MQVEHTRTQKTVALIAFGMMAVLSVVAIADRLHGGAPALVIFLLVLGATAVLVLLGYACLFTFTYRFQADEDGIVRTVGSQRTKIRWDEVVSWSIKTRTQSNTFNQEPVLKTVDGAEVGLDSRVWYSSPNMAQARKEFLELVQTRLPEKQERRLS